MPDPKTTPWLALDEDRKTELPEQLKCAVEDSDAILSLELRSVSFTIVNRGKIEHRHWLQPNSCA